jgi:hypothetical protein
MVLISIKTGAVPINRNHLQSLRGSKINHKMRIPKILNTIFIINFNHKMRIPVKSIAKDMENMAAAYYSYQDRKGQYPSTTSDDAFWYDLKTEGFISGVLGTSTDSDGPTHAYDGSYYMVNLTAASGGLDAHTYICANNIDGEIASNLDVKYDDGVNSSGTWRGITNATPVVAAAAAAYTAGTLVALCREL